MPFENLQGVVDPEGEAIKRHAMNEAIKDQIGHLDFEQITTVLDNIEVAIGENPDFLKDPSVREKIEKARQRLDDLLKQNQETLH